MEVFKNAVAAVSVTLVFFGLALNLMPEGTMKKPFKSFISVAVIAVLVVVLSSNSDALQNIDINDIDIVVSDNFAIVDTNEQTSLRVTEQTVRDIVLEKLNNNGVLDAQVSVSANISDESVISITETVVFCDPKDMPTCRKILNDLGLVGKVYERK